MIVPEGALAGCDVDVHDVEQVRVHGHLLLCVEAELPPARVAAVRAAVRDELCAAGAGVTIEPLSETETGARDEQRLITLLAPEVDAATLGGVTGCVARCDGNIEGIVRLSAYPVHSYEVSLAGADVDGLRRAGAEEAARRQVDLAIQPAGLHRRAKHLIVMDAHSTLVQGEVIDLPAAMAGEVDFEEALRQRVRLLAG